MYAQTLKELIDSLSEISDPNEVGDLIDRSMLCYLNSLANQINGTLFPHVNPVDLLIQASVLSSTIANNPQLPHIEKLHYVSGMLLEQQGGLIARSYIEGQMDVSPQENDYWYLLTLAFLHYLAGGHRIQAKTIVNNLGQYIINNQDDRYKNALRDIKRLFSDQYDYDRDFFFIRDDKIKNLINQIKSIRVVNLIDLGFNNESEWLARRGITGRDAIKFWNEYLLGLSTRGITTFTKEQINGDFDTWLRTDNDLLTILPTGSGKTIIAELKTALTLASGKQVVWLLPMRSLVRQTQREMNLAFNQLNIPVQELPTTDDYIPLFSDIIFSGPLVAITTPEKFQALIRINEGVLKNIGLVVVDEAQNLFENRGYAIESDLFQITTSNPDCKIVFLSAMVDKASKLIEFYNHLRPNSELTKLISTNRPTRCSYGIYTSLLDEFQTPTFVCYPALDNMAGNQRQPRIISLPRTTKEDSLDVPTLIKTYIKNAQQSELKSIIFVSRKDSAEARVKEYSKTIGEIIFPDDAQMDLARIKIERGTDSPFADSYKHKIAPHHGALPKIEHYFIEKWLIRGLIRHVVATPTLAQGVNLPFDISIITFLQRYQKKIFKPLSQAEVINMLGRAGRAGMVSDGLALIAQKNTLNDNNTRTILNNHRHWFFANDMITDKYIGLSGILINLLDGNFTPKNWLIEFSGFGFNEAMSLNIIMAKAVAQNDDRDLETRLKDDIQKFPSINDLQNKIGPDQNVSAFFAGLMAPILTELSTYSDEVVKAVALTGLPVEYVSTVIEKLGEINWDENDESLDLATNIVEQSLLVCNERNWFKNLIMSKPTMDLAEVFSSVKKWMGGTPWDEIAQGFTLSFKNSLIDTGNFLNNTLLQIAQFWGCLAVCEKILWGPDSHRFDFLQPYIRNGVNSKPKLMVLKAIGYLDRVLAHRITPLFRLADDDSIQDIQIKVQDQLKRWKFNREIIPAELNLDEVMALKSILEDLYIP